MSKRSNDVRLAPLVYLTLMPDAGCEYERPWLVLTHSLSNWYRKGDDTCTLVNTVDGKTFLVKETPFEIEERL